MPFRYEVYESPFTGSIAQLIGEQGRIRANALRTQAEIAGRAQTNSAEGWNRAIQTIGQLAGSVANSYADYSQQEPERLLRQRQLQQVTAADAKTALETKQRDTMNRLLSDALVEDPESGVLTYDRERLHRAVADAGLESQWIGAIQPMLEKSDASVQAAHKASMSALSDVAHMVDALGNDPQVFSAELARAVKNRLVLPADAEQLQSALQNQPTADTVARITGSILGKKPEYRNVSPGEAVVDLNKPGAGPVYTAPPKPPEPASMQSKDVMVNGKPVVANYNPKTGVYTDQQGNPLDNVSPVPPASVQIHNQQAASVAGDFGKTGEDFLKTIPVQWRSTVKKIGSYDEDPATATTARGGMRETLIQWVNQFNPEYKADEFKARAPMRQAFTKGAQGQALNSLNTAIGHLDQFVAVADDLNNGSFKPGNRAYNWVKEQFGSSAPTNFDGIRTIMSGELASAFKKSGATDQEISAVLKSLDAANSPQQLKDYATKIAIPALGSKVLSYDAQWKQVMGAEDPFKILLPESERILVKYGFDPAHPTMGGGGARVFSVTAPDGKTYSFPSQQQLDAFKASAGIK